MDIPPKLVMASAMVTSVTVSIFALMIGMSNFRPETVTLVVTSCLERMPL
jgi:hypothetical protein